MTRTRRFSSKSLSRLDREFGIRSSNAGTDELCNSEVHRKMQQLLVDRDSIDKCAKRISFLVPHIASYLYHIVTITIRRLTFRGRACIFRSKFLPASNSPTIPRCQRATLDVLISIRIKSRRPFLATVKRRFALPIAPASRRCTGS